MRDLSLCVCVCVHTLVLLIYMRVCMKSVPQSERKTRPFVNVSQFDVQALRTFLISHIKLPSPLIDICIAYDTEKCRKCDVLRRVAKSLACFNLFCQRLQNRPAVQDVKLSYEREKKAIEEGFREGAKRWIFDPFKNEYTTKTQRLRFELAARVLGHQSVTINASGARVFKCSVHKRIANRMQDCGGCSGNCRCQDWDTTDEGDLTCDVDSDVAVRVKRIIIVAKGTRLTGEQIHCLLRQERDLERREPIPILLRLGLEQTPIILPDSY